MPKFPELNQYVSHTGTYEDKIRRWIRNVSFLSSDPFVKHRGVIFAQLRARVYTNSELLRVPDIV